MKEREILNRLSTPCSEVNVALKIASRLTERAQEYRLYAKGSSFSNEAFSTKLTEVDLVTGMTHTRGPNATGKLGGFIDRSSNIVSAY
jgi:hypothetical protein